MLPMAYIEAVQKKLFLQVVSCGPFYCVSRNFWEDSDGMAVPLQNGNLTRDIPNIELAYHWAADVA